MTTRYVDGELHVGIGNTFCIKPNFSPLNLLPVVTRVEPLERPPGAAVHGAPGCSEGHRLVSPPARPAGLRRRHRRPLHPLLEHSDRPALTVHRHRVSGLQPGLVQAHKWTGESPIAQHHLNYISIVKLLFAQQQLSTKLRRLLNVLVNMWKTLFSAGQHTWLFTEPDPGVEVSLSHSSGQAYWTFLQSTLPGQ